MTDQRTIDQLQQAWVVQHATGRCLHVGCGMKHIPGAVNLDPNPERYRWAEVAGDGARLPFVAGAFDSLVSSHVLNLFGDISAALREMARVLRPGGTMAHVVPDWRFAPDRLASHWRYERQAVGWKGPQAFVASLRGLDEILNFVCIENFREFNWSFKVEAVRR